MGQKLDSIHVPVIHANVHWQELSCPSISEAPLFHVTTPTQPPINNPSFQRRSTDGNCHFDSISLRDGIIHSKWGVGGSPTLADLYIVCLYGWLREGGEREGIFEIAHKGDKVEIGFEIVFDLSV